MAMVIDERSTNDVAIAKHLRQARLIYMLVGVGSIVVSQKQVTYCLNVSEKDQISKSAC
jgi:hypothetical protein